jgi:hypothetical protein
MKRLCQADKGKKCRNLRERRFIGTGIIREVERCCI